MAQLSPVVAWNQECKHHFTVIERRKKGMIHSSCYECGDEVAMPLSMMAEWKRHLRAAVDVQVILWLVLEHE